MDQFWAYSWWCEFGFVLSIYCHIIPGPSKLVVATCLLSDWLNSFCNIICQIALNIIWSLSARLTGTPLCQRAFSLETIWGWSFGPKVNLGMKFSHWRQSGGEGLVQRFVPWGNLGLKFSHWRQLGVRVWSKGSSLDTLWGWSFLTGGNLGGEGLVQRFVPWGNQGVKFSHWRQSGGEGLVQRFVTWGNLSLKLSLERSWRFVKFVGLVNLGRLFLTNCRAGLGVNLWVKGSSFALFWEGRNSVLTCHVVCATWVAIL